MNSEKELQFEVEFQNQKIEKTRYFKIRIKMETRIKNGSILFDSFFFREVGVLHREFETNEKLPYGTGFNEDEVSHRRMGGNG